jgi:hypothetical protein
VKRVHLRRRAFVTIFPIGNQQTPLPRLAATGVVNTSLTRSPFASIRFIIRGSLLCAGVLPVDLLAGRDHVVEDQVPVDIVQADRLDGPQPPGI